MPRETDEVVCHPGPPLIIEVVVAENCRNTNHSGLRGNLGSVIRWIDSLHPDIDRGKPQVMIRLRPAWGSDWIRPFAQIPGIGSPIPQCPAAKSRNDEL